MQAWIDDSGAKGQAGWMAFGGLIGVSEDWAEFSDRWDRVLHAEPAIEYLSTHEAATLTNQFEGWPTWQRDAKVRRLATIAKDFPFVVVSVSVDLSFFASLKERLLADKKDIPAKSPIHKRRRTFSEQPYFFLFHNMCSAVCLEMVWNGVKEEIDLVFDQHDIMKPRIKEWYPMYLSGLREHERAIMPAEPIFRDDKKHLPLQMADFVAWVERATLNGNHNPFASTCRSLKRLKRSRYCGMWNSDRFERVFLYQHQQYSPSPAEAEYRAQLHEYLALDD